MSATLFTLQQLPQGSENSRHQQHQQQQHLQLPKKSPAPSLRSFRAFRLPSSIQDRASIGNLFSAFTGEFLEGASSASLLPRNVNYGSISFATGRQVVDSDSEDDGEEAVVVEDEEEDRRWWVDRLLISPRRKVVKRMMRRWYSRWFFLIFLPAFISILWCAVPFPTRPIDETTPNGGRPDWHFDASSVRRKEAELASASGFFGSIGHAFENVFDFALLWEIVKQWWETLRNYAPSFPGEDDGHHTPGGTGGPGHGKPEVILNFYFFLVPYYAFYNLVGLLWITKIFNMYSLNWWPPRLGFPPTFIAFNILPLMVAVVLYDILPEPLIRQNLVWRLLSFTVMCSPVIIAFLVLYFERLNHRLGHQRGLSDTQLLFHTDSPVGLRRGGSRHLRAKQYVYGRLQMFALPRSYKRFLWFCLAVLLTLIAFVLGEAYSELYLRSLPHNSLETVIYVWGWVATIWILDGTTGYIVGAKINSYPLEVAMKLYYMLTYQTYVRALYARLRSPSQFVYLQLLSSTIVVIWSPIMMTTQFHSFLRFLRLNYQPYTDWRKNIGRTFFLRGLAESISMVAWLGWVVVLHYGYNKKIYKYFSFEDPSDPYTFRLTFWASLATWAAELCAGWIVRRLMERWFTFQVTKEAVGDFGKFPELMPAAGLVSVHVLTSMLLSIVRLKFY